MNTSKNRNWSIKRSFVIALVCPSLLFLLSFTVSAQTKVTATSNTIIDPNKPQPITLHVTKTADGSIDTDVIGKVVSVQVGDHPKVSVKPDSQKGDLTFTPPANLSSTQTVQLLDKDDKPVLDKDGKPLGQVQLTYQGGGGQQNTGPTTTPTPTPLAEELRRNKLADYNWYYLIVTVMFLGLLVPFIATIVRAIRFSRSTYRSPLGLPVGSFRAILAYTLVVFLGFYILASILSISYFGPPDFLLGIVATVIGFYFGSRTGDEGDADAKTGIVRGIVSLEGKPALGAQVTFNDGKSDVYSRITDVNGRFELQGAKPAQYTITAKLNTPTASGTEKVTVVEGSDHEIAIILKSATGNPQTGSVQGTVTKPDGSPAGGATVELKQGDAVKKATSDNAGKYKIENVAAGDCEITASLSGNTPSDTGKVKVTAGATQTVDLKLK